MSLVEYSLPSGGTAWLRSRLGHDAALELRVMASSLLPTKALERIGREGGDITVEALADNDVELSAALAAMSRVQAATIRAVVHHWDGVTTADGDPAIYPGDVGALDEATFDELYKACEAALAKGRADPNAGGAR